MILPACALINLSWFDDSLRDWTRVQYVKPNLLCTGEILTPHFASPTKTTASIHQKFSHILSRDGHSMNDLNAAVFAGTLFYHRMSKTSHLCLRLENLKRGFIRCGDTSSKVRPLGEIQLPIWLSLHPSPRKTTFGLRPTLSHSIILDL